MHEFLLFGQVANDEHHKLLQQLAGVTRMQPQHVVERHLIFRAKPPVGLSNIPSGGGSQGLVPPEVQKTKQMLSSSIFYLQLVYNPRSGGAQLGGNRDGLGNGDISQSRSTTKADASGSSQEEGGLWTIEFRDIPEPGKQAVTTRLLSRTPTGGGDLIQFVKDLGFEYGNEYRSHTRRLLTASSYVSQYVLEGHKFYDQDMTLFVHQVLKMPQAPDEQAIATNTPIPPISELQPLDGSKAFVLQASIEAVDGNNPEVKEKAVQQLMVMKETLKQAVTLAPGDRLALDTRVPMRNNRP
jgi:mediator of RNA polymerase II transcription subunit 18